jgi:hypothetical protein
MGDGSPDFCYEVGDVEVLTRPLSYSLATFGKGTRILERFQTLDNRE